MNLDGTLVDGVEPWFGKSIIRSCCKLDYGSAQKMLDGTITNDNVDEWEEDRRPIPGANPSITNATVIQSVKDLWSIGENRRAMRFDTGAVSLNDMKLVFSLDAKGNPTRYGSYELKDSNRLVEEYMLLANYLVAQQLLRAHGPLAFLRHHPPPVSRSMEQALEQLDKSDIKLDGRSTKQLTESLERVRQERGETTFAIVQALIIKPMKPAEYMVAGNGASSDSWRHYALNIPYYTHFTSPIRRYADVVVHRLLQESVLGSSTLDTSDSEDSESRMMEFTSVAQNCNEKKMTSKNAEKECDKVFLCAYVQHYGDVEVTGVVLNMGQKSFTVHILELGLEQRLFLQEINLRGLWNEKTSQLSIRLPAPQEKQEDDNTDHKVDDMNAKKNSPAELVKLSFMKQLRLRMSTTKKMPLALSFFVIGEKSDDEEFLLASFTGVEIHASSSDLGEDDDGETQTLAHSGSVGALFVTTSRVIWLSAVVGACVGYAWEMSAVTLHAISRDPLAFPKPCLYCQISNQDVSEVRFVPVDDKTLQEVFDAFSKSAEMNPDDDDDDDDGWICDEDEVADGARAAQLAAHFDAVLQVSPELENGATEIGQFDDADEDNLL
ncbi:nuclease [Phytophthora palmivora]|uniref:Nuclease n=1 Tax=Phytophthora palmivora TaxID=4796 RepID=A0A2P4X6K4_9STRA|nr:nuclease [Phytophthora palmivora]